MATLKAGALAYYDSFVGLVPCKVLSIRGESGRVNSAQEVTFQITASRGPYKRGEIMRRSALWVAPRDAIKWGKYGVVVLPYAVECGSDDGDLGVAVEPRTVRCECGDYTGERCEWTGSPEETVVVEYMPEHLRASHEAARNVGRYPHNGAVRIRCEKSCAESIVENDPDWAQIVGE